MKISIVALVGFICFLLAVQFKSYSLCSDREKYKKYLPFLLLFLIFIALANCYGKKDKTPEIKKVTGADLYVRTLPEKVISFIKEHYPVSDKRMIIFDPRGILWAQNATCPVADQLKKYVIPLLQDNYYIQKYSIIPLELFRTKKEVLRYHTFCDKIVCIFDLEEGWVFSWDKIEYNRAREAFDAFVKL